MAQLGIHSGRFCKVLLLCGGELDMATAVDLNQPDDTSLDPKPTRQHAPVDPAPVRSRSGEQNEVAPRPCNTFNIREFVAQTRETNPERCNPFPTNGSADPLKLLPPMKVCIYRFWQCVAAAAMKELQKDSFGTGREVALNFGNANGPTLLVGPSSKVNNGVVIRNGEANASTDPNDNRNSLQVSDILPDRKGKGIAYVGDELPLGSVFGNGFLKDCLTQLIQPHMRQTDVIQTGGNEVEFRSTSIGKGTPEAPHQAFRVDRIEAGPSNVYANDGKASDAGGNQPGKSQTSSGHQPVGLPANGVEAAIERDVDEPPNHIQDNDDYLGAERRKKPKMRFVAELLGLKETQGLPKGKKKTPSSSSQDENVKRKRSTTQDEGSKSIEIRGSNEGSKKSVSSIDISESENDPDSNDVSTEKVSEALAKKRCKPRDPLLEKCTKKIKVDHGESSSLSRQRIKAKSASAKGKYTEKAVLKTDIFAKYKLSNSVVTKKRGKVHQARKESSSSAPSRSQMLKESRVALTNGVAEQCATANVVEVPDNLSPSSRLAKDNEQLSTHPRKDGPILPASHAESVPVDGTRVQKPNENQNIKEVVVLRNTSVQAPFTVNHSVGESSAGPSTNSQEPRGRISEGGEPSHPAQRMPMQPSHPAQRMPMQPSHLPQRIPMQAVNPVVNQRAPANEFRRIQDIDINSIPIDEKVNEQDTGDDVPMDIVELMAKNQYERHLEAKDKHKYPAHPSISGTYATQNGTCGTFGQIPAFMQSQIFSSQKQPSSDPRNSMFNGNLSHFSDFHRNSLGGQGLTREKGVSERFFFPGQGQQDKLVSAGFLTPGQGQEHMRPYSPLGFAPNSWNGKNVTATQHNFPSFLLAAEQYQKNRATGPRQNAAEAPRYWSSGMTSRMPLGITNPQMISQSSSALNKGKMHQQSSGSILNFNAATNVSYEPVPNLNFFSGVNSAKPVPNKISGKSESSARSDEAIPAMHLLSLMQNAGKGSNTELSLGPQKVVGPVSSRQPFIRNNRTSDMQDKNGHPCYPNAVPTACSFTTSFQNDGHVSRGNARFTIPLTLGGQRNMDSSHFGPPSAEHQPQRRSVATPLDKGKAVVSMLKPSYINNSQQVMKDSSNLQPATAVRRVEKRPLPEPDTMVCQLNQNPSEFNDLKLVSQYMISSEDLRPSKKARDKAPRPKGHARKSAARENKSSPSGADRKKQRES